MSQAIELESIRRLAVNPGETLVATLAGHPTTQVAVEVRDQLTPHLPDAVNLLIVSSDIDLSVLSADRCQSDPA